MRISSSIAGLALAGVAVLAGGAAGHGGTYRGPLDTVPPGGGGGSRGGGPAPGGPAGPAGPGGSPGAGPAGPLTGAPTGGAPGVPSSTSAPRTGIAVEEDLSQWSLWWEFNKDPFLQLKSKLHASEPETGSTDFLLGRGEQKAARDVLRPSARQIDDEVLPALLAALARETHNDVVTGCLVALAKIGRARGGDAAAALAPRLRPFLADANQEIAETAALALGLLGGEASAALLVDVLADAPAGRAACGGAAVSERTRAFAAYGLGLALERSAARGVKEELATRAVAALAAHARGGASSDVGVACVLALGLAPLPERGTAEGPPESGREALLERLLALAEDRDADSALRAHAPRSAARLAADASPALRASAAERLVELVQARRVPELVRQGVVLGLGSLGDCDGDAVDVRIRRALADLVEGAADVQTRAFARVALGRVGGRDGAGDPGVGRAEIADLLTASLARGAKTQRQWSALALGAMGHELASRGLVPAGVKLAVRKELEDAKSPDDIGALSVAAGLLRDNDARAALLDKLERTSVDDARGYAALGLGLLGDRRVIDELTGVLAESKFRPELLRQAAVALGLLGDRAVAERLADMLGEAKALASQASIAAALGFIGDARSIPRLVAMLEDRALTASARGFAAVALGAVADNADLPWTVAYAVDMDYRAAPETLNANSLGTGVLNIL